MRQSIAVGTRACRVAYGRGLRASGQDGTAMETRRDSLLAEPTLFELTSPSGRPLKPFRSPTARWYLRQLSAHILARGAQIGSLPCTWYAAGSFAPVGERNQGSGLLLPEQDPVVFRAFCPASLHRPLHSGCVCVSNWQRGRSAIKRRKVLCTEHAWRKLAQLPILGNFRALQQGESANRLGDRDLSRSLDEYCS